MFVYVNMFEFNLNASILIVQKRERGYFDWTHGKDVRLPDKGSKGSTMAPNNLSKHLLFYKFLLKFTH